MNNERQTKTVYQVTWFWSNRHGSCGLYESEAEAYEVLDKLRHPEDDTSYAVDKIKLILAKQLPA